MAPAATPAPVAYPIDPALHEQRRKALRSRKPSEMAAAQLALDIRDHELFGRLVAELHASGVRIEEPRQMAVTAKVALMAAPDFAPEESPLAQARALARLIMHDLNVSEDEQDATVRQVMLMARECLPRRVKVRV